MNLFINQLKCAFNGHQSSFNAVKKLNKSKYKDNIKLYKTNCERCGYPLILKKYKSRPYRYEIIEN